MSKPIAVAKHDYVRVRKGAVIHTTNPERRPWYVNTKNRKVWVIEVHGNEVHWTDGKRWLYRCPVADVQIAEVPE